MRRAIHSWDTVVVEADLPRDVEAQTRSGLWMPAWKRAERFGRANGDQVAFGKGDIQVVSGTVVSAPSHFIHAFSVPAPVAYSLMEAGTIWSMRHTSTHHCDITARYDAPKPGDKVWLRYGAWGAAEDSGLVHSIDGRLLGKIHYSNIHLCGNDGDWRCPGPWAVCEPLPFKIDSNAIIVSNQLVGMRKGERVARVCGHAPHLQSPTPGDLVFHAGHEMMSCPVPFSDTEWFVTRLQDIHAIGEAPGDTEISRMWEALWAHNREISAYMKGKEWSETALNDEIAREQAAEMAHNMYRDALRRYRKWR